jgi:hypothetical protein
MLHRGSLAALPCSDRKIGGRLNRRFSQGRLGLEASLPLRLIKSYPLMFDLAVGMRLAHSESGPLDRDPRALVECRLMGR